MTASFALAETRQNLRLDGEDAAIFGLEIEPSLDLERQLDVIQSFLIASGGVQGCSETAVGQCDPQLASFGLAENQGLPVDLDGLFGMTLKDV